MMVNPFIFGWLNFVLDTVDGDLLIPLGMEDTTYQPIDKFADYVTYVFMVVVGWKWFIKKEILVTFALRTVGQALFFITNNEIVFFYFPNFLEPLFLVYATMVFYYKKEKKAFEKYKKHRPLIWGLIFFYKMQDEYITHVGNVDRTEFIKGLFK